MRVNVKGGLRTFAAICTEVCNADEADLRCIGSSDRFASKSAASIHAT